MDKAKDRRDGREYTAHEVAQLSRAQRQALKAHLCCLYCPATAHFRSASRSSPSRRGKVEHFYCLPHGDECDITRRYADPWETEEGDLTVTRWEQRDATLIVRIAMSPEAGSDESSAGSEGTESESRSQGGGDRTRSSNFVSRGPQKLLEQLVEWPSFKTSSLTIRMPDPDRTEMAVHDAFVRFESAELERHTATWHGFWGIVRPLSYWALGETYFSNFGVPNSSFRIAIHRNQVPSILSRYGLSRIEDLVGHYLLLFDNARESTSGRFMADVNSIEYTGFLRNNED